MHAPDMIRSLPGDHRLFFVGMKQVLFIFFECKLVFVAKAYSFIHIHHLFITYSLS